MLIVGDVVEQLQATRQGEDRLPEGDLDVGELSVGEDPLAADGRSLGTLEDLVGSTPTQR
jgi:hypothetical protein